MWITATLSILLAYITLVAIEKVQAFRALNFYKKQGIKCVFHIMNGFSDFMKAPSGSIDQFERLKNLYASHSDEDIIVFNQSRGSDAIVLLINRDIISEYYKKEFQISNKGPLYHPVSIGFIDHGGQEAMRKKTLFKKFFHLENLDKLLPDIHQIIKDNLYKVKQENWPLKNEEGKFKSIDFSRITLDICSDVIDFLVLGHDQRFKINNKRVTIQAIDGLVKVGKYN